MIREKLLSWLGGGAILGLLGFTLWFCWQQFSPAKNEDKLVEDDSEFSREASLRQLSPPKIGGKQISAESKRQSFHQRFIQEFNDLRLSYAHAGPEVLRQEVQHNFQGADLPRQEAWLKLLAQSQDWEGIITLLEGYPDFERNTHFLASRIEAHMALGQSRQARYWLEKENSSLRPAVHEIFSALLPAAGGSDLDNDERMLETIRYAGQVKDPHAAYLIMLHQLQQRSLDEDSLRQVMLVENILPKNPGDLFQVLRENTFSSELWLELIEQLLVEQKGDKEGLQIMRAYYALLGGHSIEASTTSLSHSPASMLMRAMRSCRLRMIDQAIEELSPHSFDRWEEPHEIVAALYSYLNCNNRVGVSVLLGKHSAYSWNADENEVWERAAARLKK